MHILARTILNKALCSTLVLACTMSSSSLIESLLRGTEETSSILLQDNVQKNGRSLLKCCICQLVQRYSKVHLFLFDAHQEKWTQTLPSNIIERLVIHDWFSDPLGWDNMPQAKLLHNFTSAFLLSELQPTSVGRLAVVFDSLSTVLLHHSAPAVCRTLQTVQNKIGGLHPMLVISLVHADLHEDHVISQLSHVMSTSIVVECSEDNSVQSGICKVKHKRHSGKVLRKTELYSIDSSYNLTIDHTPSLLNSKPDTSVQPDPTANLTFDLTLSSKEKRDRANVVLPYTIPQDVGVAQNRIGQIFYQPDEVDDFDESDPDDDLDI